MVSGADKTGVSFGLPPPAFALAALIMSIAGALLLDPMDAGFGVGLSVLVLWVTAVDLDRFEIPDIGVGLLLITGLIWVYFASYGDWTDVLDACARSIAAAALFYLIRAAYRAWRGIDGLGLGDVKLAAAAAPWLSWSSMPTALFIAVAGAAILTVARAILSRSRINPMEALPLGAFMAPALWLTWIWTQTDGFSTLP